MASCLGIYLNNSVVKYAKLTSDNGNNVKIESYGVRFIKESQMDTLKNIIDETNSSNTPIIMNPQGSRFINYQMFDQVQNSGVANDVAKMEFESWCEKNAKVPDRYTYIFKNAEIKNEENKFNSVIDFTEKAFLKEYQKIGESDVSAIYPPELLLGRLVPKEEQNYMLVNLDNTLSLQVFLDGKLRDIRFYDVGMEQILNDFAAKLGSYQKAYEACKQLNVYSDDAANNDKLLESIAEPVLQEILRNIAGMATRYKGKIAKVILTGTGIVFTNIDILIREFINLRCEILKPECVNVTNIRNIAEALETTLAISLANEYFIQQDTDLNFMVSNSKLKRKVNSFFAKLLKPNPKKNVQPKNVNKNVSQNSNMQSMKMAPNASMNPNNNIGMQANPKGPNGNMQKQNIFATMFNKQSPSQQASSEAIGAFVVTDTTDFIAMCVGIVAVVVLVAYTSFTLIYTKSVNDNLKKIESAKTTIQKNTASVKADTSYISASTTKYQEINSKVSDVVEKIENNKIGKFSTYNVASFLQNIVKVIPRNVRLTSLTSDDNKNIVLTATSSSYADLGYFVAALKINSTLKDVKINKIENGDVTTVEIGGELP